MDTFHYATGIPVEEGSKDRAWGRAYIKRDLSPLVARRLDKTAAEKNARYQGSGSVANEKRTGESGRARNEGVSRETRTFRKGPTFFFPSNWCRARIFRYASFLFRFSGGRVVANDEVGFEVMLTRYRWSRRGRNFWKMQASIDALPNLLQLFCENEWYINKICWLEIKVAFIIRGK